MAGSVTGNLGSENITLRNMATEDTLASILEVLGTKTISNKGTEDLAKGASKAAKAAHALTAAASGAVDSIKNAFGGSINGTVKIIRNLDSEINNVSYTFSTMATSLQRQNSDLYKVFQFAAESVAQMNEEYKTYSKMMQVGGSVTSEFGRLRETASSLGTDLVGLTALTEQYAYSLKIGSSTVGGGLKKLQAAYSEMTDQTVYEFGRLGVLPEKISEQLLLAAEAQGGVGDVMKRFGGNTKEFSKGMLKSTQELNVFATAIGSNSQMMQQEMAKAQQKITNRIFMSGLTENENKATAFLQAFTGSAEDAIGVMRMYKTGLASQNSAMFESLKGYTGMGNQIETFVDLVSKGSEPFEAIKNSGLLSFAKNMSEANLQSLNTQITALANSGEPQAALLAQQLTFIKGLRDTDPDKMASYIKEMTDAFDPKKSKTVDSFTSLQQQQIQLAKSTAHLNSQINRLGLSLASGMMKTTNLGLGAAGKGIEGIKQYTNALLKSYGINAEIPKDLLEGPVEKLEEWAQTLINVKLEQPETTNTTTTNANANANNNVRVPSSADTINVKGKAGEALTIRLADLINDAKVRATTEAFKGNNNQAGTMIAAALLQQRVKSLGVVTAGDDNDPIHNKTGKHPLGRALDFRVNRDPNKTDEQNYLDTEENIKRVMKELGLEPKDFAVIRELNAKGGPHMHVEIEQAAVNKLRDDYIRKLDPNYQPPTNNNQVQGSAQESGSPTGKNSQATQGTVNTIPVVSVNKPEWFDEAMNNSKTELKTWMQQMSRDFDKLATTLAKKF